MLKIWPALLAFLIWAAFAIFIHEYLSNKLLGECAITHFSSNSTKEFHSYSETLPDTLTEKSVTNSFFIQSPNGNNVFEFLKGFETNASNGNVEVPNELKGIQDSVYAYLNANLDQKLMIEAKYLTSENGEHHLGELRAQKLKELFVAIGINPNRIQTSSVEADYVYNYSNEYFDGVSVNFATISQKDTEQIEQNIANKTLYSNFAVMEFIPDNKLIAYTLELKAYLKKYPKKKIYIVGHTDSVGENNDAFGLNRANTVRDYFMMQDIPSSIMITSSKGENEPIATNKTEEGRAMNRRIEITIN